MKRRKINYNYERLIDIHGAKLDENEPLFNIESPENYPVFEDSTANFITDYLSNYSNFDFYTVRMYGERIAKFLSFDDSEILEEFDKIINSILSVHLSEWARLYYALDLKYNPIYNVDGVTTYVYGEKEREEDIKQRKRSEKFPQAVTTNTEYDVAFDSATEKESGKTTSSTELHTNEFTDDAHKDVFTDKTHTDTETRKGNIGVTMTQQMLEAEFELRKKSFFNTMIKTFIEEAGFMYA